MVHIVSFIIYMYMKNKWIQRLHDNVSGNWQNLTTMDMVYEINKSRDLKKRTANHF